MGSIGSVGINPALLAASQSKSAFGELLVQQLTPQVVTHFPYKINTDIVNSVVDYDTAGTTITGGTLVATMAMSKIGNKDLLFSDYDFIMAPGATMTVAALSSSNNDVTVGISWQERFS